MKRPTRKRAPEANPTPTIAISRATDNSGLENAQVLHLTLQGVAARTVAQLRHAVIPDLWHVARWPQLNDDKEGILLVWYVAHHLKRALQQQEGGAV